ncbi:MAG: ABC transporter ATP-binding protein/permease [Clostridia bacterium]|nr:ABC transporter ATP-binding protein/permease [Clostridia bacterium]
MKFIWSYLKDFKKRLVVSVGLKTLAAFTELLIPYVLEHLVDDIAPTKDLGMVIFWGCVMLLLAVAVRVMNVEANRRAVKISSECAFSIRKDLFRSSLDLSGGQVDEFGLPSLTSRMTSDSYNVQNFLRSVQLMGVRAPIMLIGGIIITLTMDVGLAMILVILAPVMIACVVCISAKGMPLYSVVQQRLDTVVRVMRENITGIRVVKALSKEDYEKRRFGEANDAMSRDERKVGIIMALPGPLVTLALNLGLTLVVLFGAKRVNAGVTEPGVILAFLTYFNMIMMAVRAFNRLFIMMSKANASAQRISAVISQPDELAPVPESEAAVPASDDYVIFDNVSFSYGEGGEDTEARFVGEGRSKALENISFSMKKGSSLGIIGATGCGKTSIINLLMRFYDADEGHVFVDGKDVRSYDKDELHRLFGVVFQNDVIFADTVAENISFGRQVSEEDMRSAAADACAAEFIENYDDAYSHMADIRGANFSGGQRQRILITRALAANPQILILDDASSALDYKTDASLRKAIREHFAETTTIIIAQRISSIMSLDDIIMLDEGRILGHGTHEELMANCPQYREIYETQMGEEA